MKLQLVTAQVLVVSCIIGTWLGSSAFGEGLSTSSSRVLSFESYVEEFNTKSHIAKIYKSNTLAALEKENQNSLLPDPVFQASKMDDLTISLTQNFPWPTTFSARSNLQETQVQQAQVSESATKAEQQWLAANDFLTWVSLHKELENSLQNMASWNKIISFLEARQQQGLGWHGELLQIQVDLEMAKSKTSALERDVANLRDMMRLRIGDTEGAADFSKEWPKTWLQKVDTESVIGPDFEQQKLSLQRRENLARLDVSRATALPNWSLGASWTQTKENMSMPGFMLGFQVPLFSWPTLSSLQQERALTEQLFQLRESQRAFEKRTALSISARRAAQAHNNVETLQAKLLPLAEQHLKITLSEFASGKKKMPDLIAAEKSLLNFKVAETLALAQLARENLLHKAIVSGIATQPSSISVPQLSVFGGSPAASMPGMENQSAMSQNFSSQQNAKKSQKRTKPGSASEVPEEENAPSRSSTMDSMGM